MMSQLTVGPQWESRKNSSGEQRKKSLERETRGVPHVRWHIPKMGHKESLYPVRKNTLHLYCKI